MLEKQTASQKLLPEVTRADAPKVQKVFGLNKMDFVSFDELINKSSQELSVEYEMFFSNSFGTQHGYMKICDGKIIKTVPLLEINILSVIPVIQGGVKVGFIVKYSLNTTALHSQEYIPRAVIEKHKICERLQIPHHGSKSKDELCERLMETLIFNAADEEKTIIIGSKQGWNIYSDSCGRWESQGRYPPILYNIIPKSIICRKNTRQRTLIYATGEYRTMKFNEIFNTWPELKIPFLIRESSYMLAFAGKYNIYFNQIVVNKLTDTADNSLLVAMYDNVSYGRGSTLTLSDAIGIKHSGEILNDAVLLVVDDTKPDESKNRENGVNVLHGKAIDCKTEYRQIPVVLSNYAATQIRPDLYCDFSELNGIYDISPAVLTELLELHDTNMILKISNNFSDYLEVFNRCIRELSIKTPYFIPSHRLNLYYILISTLRAYDEYFGIFFGDETESKICDILSRYDEVGTSNDEMLLTLFGKCLNEEISNGRFSFIKRTKYIIFDKGTDMIIVDDDYIYIETDIIKKLARNKLKLHSVNSLTEAWKANHCLNINDQNSKCYRFHVQNSDGESYMLYTYGISKQFVNAENRKRLELADYQKFLLNYAELKEKTLLPLGITLDGHFISKDISYNNKSNDSIFLTGQSGKGKSFCATNLLPSLAMLGSRMLVWDVSDSFTRDEVLRSLPEQVVDELFEFIEVAVGKRKLPVDPLFIGDCIGLPAKKRRMVGFVKAIAGKLDKEESKTLAGIFSEMFKKNPKISSVSTEMLRNTLKRGGKVGNHVYNLITSTLDDIDNIGFEKQGWAEFFEKTKKIPVVSYGYESGDNVHSLLDAMIASAFEWQRDHDTAPLNVVVDEIKDQNFAEGSPLHTILTQGRKFNTKFIGMTQQYISTSSHAIDVVKEAGIKIFFKPSKSLERIASELGYKNPTDAGFGSMGIGDFILSCDCYNKVDCVNEPVVIHCKTIKFVDTPLYKRFETEYLT